MKLYGVVWEEKHRVMIIAKNEKEAIDKIYDNEYEEDQKKSEISSEPEAFLEEEVK